MTSAALYEQVWSNERYRHAAPGAYLAEQFIQVAKPQLGQTVRDLGCGTGRAGAVLAAYGLEVTLYDWAANAVDEQVRLPFVQHDLTKPIDGPPADFVFTSDFLEHIAPEDVPVVLRNVTRAGRRAFLSIDCLPDQMGAQLVGERLHLTVENHDWWKAQLEAVDCRIIWSEDREAWCSFYVSAYANGFDFIERSVLNVTEDEVRANIRANLEAGYQEAQPYQQQDCEVMILAGGPSLGDCEEEIRAQRADGMRLVTVNGTYNWCIERGLTPSIQIVCDGREFNKRFVAPPVERCRYLIASQCHPSLAASLPKEQVTLWHSGDSYPTQEEMGLKKWQDWYPILGGGTVILRAIPLLLMLGYHKFHFYGFDSCLRERAHHAYTQPENDGALEVEVTVGGRTFRCHPWMVCQAQDFQKLVSIMGNTVEMAVRGDGLIAHILNTAAAASET